MVLLKKFGEGVYFSASKTVFLLQRKICDFLDPIKFQT